MGYMNYHALFQRLSARAEDHNDRCPVLPLIPSLPSSILEGSSPCLVHHEPLQTLRDRDIMSVRSLPFGGRTRVGKCQRRMGDIWIALSP